jgi:hypothetical protein
MQSLTSLQTNSPILNEDLTLGILSCTINVEGVIKTYYFQHLEGGLIVNDKLASQLRLAFEGAAIQEGDNGISTGLDSFIPTEIMDTSLIGIRQVGIDHLDQTYSTMTIEHIGMKGARVPQALLYAMLDSVLQEYKSSFRILRFHISNEVISIANQQGFYQYLTKFTELRGLQREIVDGVEIGYKHEDRLALEVLELKKKARQIEGALSSESRLEMLRLQSGIKHEHKSESVIKPRKPFSLFGKFS